MEFASFRALTAPGGMRKVGIGCLPRLVMWTRRLCMPVFICLGAAWPALAAPPKRVLVLYENGRLLPANIEGDRGLNETIAASGVPVDVRAEFLDYPDFGGGSYI